jgi:A/G-specific adenine glycosylase
MLQQTRADQATPYFERFIAAFPDVRALAGADRADVLKAWEGLGYYGRARRLQDAARLICDERGGRFPANAEEWKTLPGVGPYTAAAIASLAFGECVPVLDGNVARVLSRVFLLEAPADSGAGRKQLYAWAEALISGLDPACFNEALMELGALCCKPRTPHCEACPLAAICRAAEKGVQEDYPHRKPRRKVPHKEVGAGVIFNRRGELLLAQRAETDMLGGLWEFPGGTREKGETMEACIARELREELGVRVRVGPRVTVVRHAFSHFTMDLHAHWVRIAGGGPRALEHADIAWVPLKRLCDYAMGKADVEIVRMLEKDFSPPEFD